MNTTPSTDRQDMTTDKRELLPAEGLVHIWSGEHQAYWRQHGGYTLSTADAGVWTAEEARKTTARCGPEKQIELRPARPSSPAPVQGEEYDPGSLSALLIDRIGQELDGECHLSEAEARVLAASLSAKPPVQSVEVGLAAFLDGLEVHLRGLGEVDSDHKRGYKAATEAIIADGRKFLASPSAPEEREDLGDRVDALDPQGVEAACSAIKRHHVYNEAGVRAAVGAYLSALSKDAKASGNQLEEIEQYLIEKSMIRPGERVADKVIRFLKHYQQVIDAYSKLAGKASGPSKDERDAVIEECEQALLKCPLGEATRTVAINTARALKHSPKAGQEKQDASAN